jgi:hypothetical protein
MIVLNRLLLVLIALGCVAAITAPHALASDGDKVVRRPQQTD